MILRFFRLVVYTPNSWFASTLMLVFVVLLPIEPLFNVPLIILGILGLLHLASRPMQLTAPENRFFCIAFLCVWLPMLASLPDAVNLFKSVRTTVGFSIYFLAGIYVLGAYTRFRDLDKIMIGVTVICIFWCLDALWQFCTGTDWFGIPYQEGEQLRGAFQTDKQQFDGRLGIVLASFASLFFEGIRRARQHWFGNSVLLVLFAIIITLSGSRTAWGALAVGTAGYLIFLIYWSTPSQFKLRHLVSTSVSLMLIVVLIAHVWPDGVARVKAAVEPRVESFSGLWSGDREQLESLTSYRLSIWETAVNMFSAHWLNGVGPRGFRFAYQEYSPEHDYFLGKKIFGDMEYPANTPHSPVLEIAAETGVLGLLGYVILFIMLLVRLYRLESKAFRSAYPYVLTLIVALFPLNGHLNFYRVFYASLIWWTIILTASAFAIAARNNSATQPME